MREQFGGEIDVSPARSASFVTRVVVNATMSDLFDQFREDEKDEIRKLEKLWEDKINEKVD